MSVIQELKKKINRNSKVLNLSHFDLDGRGCSIVLKNVFKNIEFIPVKYGSVDETCRKIDFEKYDIVIMTDVSPESIEIFNLSNKFILIDHHDTSTHLNSEKDLRFVIPGKSASILVKEFFETLFKIDLSYLNKLCNIINNYDLWNTNEDWDVSWSFNELYFKMYHHDFVNRFSNGDIKMNEDEIKYIKDRKKLLREVYDNLNIYELDSIKACFFIENRFVNDICHKLMEEKDYKVTICINSKSKTCSVRSKLESLHIGEMLRQIDLGCHSGGHQKSGAFRLSDKMNISEQIDRIEKYLFWKYEECKR